MWRTPTTPPWVRDIEVELTLPGEPPSNPRSGH
jgi:hypothetical protein